MLKTQRMVQVPPGSCKVWCVELETQYSKAVEAPVYLQCLVEVLYSVRRRLRSYTGSNITLLAREMSTGGLHW